MSIRAAREHSSDPLNPVLNRYQQELIQLRNQRTLVTDPDSQRIQVDSRSRLKYYDCFNQQAAITVGRLFQYPLEPDFNNLTIWYRFDQTGNTMKDLSCFDNHANIVGNPKLVEGLNFGQFGGTIALQCDGAGDYFWTPEGLNGAGRITNLTDGFAVGCIIYPQDISNANSENPVLFYKKDDDSGNYGYTAQITSTGKLFFASKINGNLTKKQTVSLPVGGQVGAFHDYYSSDYDPDNYDAGSPNYFVVPNWYIIWFLSDMLQPPNLKIFVNGSLLTLEATTIDDRLTQTSTHDTFIAAGDNGSRGYYPGIIQDYRFMKRQVTQPEITYHNTNKLSVSNIAYGQPLVSGGTVFNGNESVFFDGVDDYIDCSDDASLWSGTMTKFSFSVWMYPTDIASTRDIVRHNTTGGGRFRSQIEPSGNKFRFYVRNAADSADGNSESAGLLSNQWVHLVGTYDNSLGSANVKIYINKVVGATTGNLTDTIPVNSYPLTLGGTNSFFKGFMRDFRFWKTKALTQTEINNVYDNSLSAPTPDYWLKINEGGGNPVDSISGTKTGVLSNGAMWRPQPNPTAVSIFLDGVDDYVDCQNDNSLWSKGLTQFSYSLWIYPRQFTRGFNTSVTRHGDDAGRFRADIFDVTGNIQWHIRNAANSADMCTCGTTTGDIVENAWNHIVCTYDKTLGSNHIKIYVNSVLKGQGTAGTPETVTDSLARMLLGGDSGFFIGSIKDFRWWTIKALTQTEVNNVYADNSSAPTPDYWLKMNDESGSPVDTISGTKVAMLKNGARWEYNV